MFRINKIIFLLLLFPGLVLAQDTFVVSDIRLEGLQRIAPSSIFGLLNVSVGDEIGQADVANIIRDVFSSDNFQNVEILQEGAVLIIRVEERPTVSEIEIDGNKMIPTEALMENMEGAGLSVGQIFKPSVLSGLQLAIKDQYIGQGRYSADVEVDIIEQPRNRVALHIDVEEGKSSKILHLNIVGNTVYPDEVLNELFELKPTHFTSIIKKDDNYSREKINGDLERLTSYYLDNGYVNFSVTSTQVSISPDKKDVYITINVDEGEVYRINKISMAGDLASMGNTLMGATFFSTGNVFSQQAVTFSSEVMNSLLNRQGYFFSEVNGIPSVNEDDKTVDVIFLVNPGERTYVNRINFYGNTETVDEVLRREMRQMETAPASAEALEASKVRLDRLGFFGEVQYETAEVPGVTDQIDVNFDVEEQLSGSIGGSIGYAQVQGLVLSASLQQANFLGTGKRVGIGLNTSAYSTSYNFSYSDPYYTIDGVSRGFSLSYVQSDYAKLNLASYTTNQLSAGINYGYVVSETQSISYNFGVNLIEIDAGFSAVQEIRTSPVLYPGFNEYIIEPARINPYVNPDTGELYPIADAVIGAVSDLPSIAFNDRTGFINRYGSDYTNFTMSVTWNEATLNRGRFPTAGHRENLSLEVSVPGSDLEYFKLQYFYERYFPLFGEFVFHARADLGYGDGYGSVDELPFFLNFYAGGLGTVRGFEPNTLGPRSTFPEQYILAPTELYKDENGNPIENIDGSGLINPDSLNAYPLVAVRDDNGEVVRDETGLPTFYPRLARRSLSGGIPLPFGGNIQTLGTIELLFPLPFIKDRSMLSSSFFIDAGNVFSSYCTEIAELLNNCAGIDPGEFRYSAGLAVNWLSGFGLMSFSVAQTFNASLIDETEVFQFTIGNGF